MSETFTPDNLFGGAVLPIPSSGETLELGQNRIRGTVLGKVKRIIGLAEADRTNTGEGTIGSEALGPKSKIGTYHLTCIAAGPPAVFQVVDPDGIRLADAEAEVPYAGPIAFLVEAYGTAFALDDAFTVEVEAGSGEVKLADKDAVDGSEDLYGILAEDTDATAAAAACPVYLGGEFSEAALTFAAGEDADDYRDEGRLLGILFRTNG
jgi:hypothetical protein